MIFLFFFLSLKKKKMSQTNILKDYTMGKVLGTGSFAVVYKAEHKVYESFFIY